MAADQHESPAEGEHEPPEPPRLRALRRLVTFLTATLAVGMIAIVGILLVRLTGTPRVPVAPVGAAPFERAIALPPGAALRSVSVDQGKLYLFTDGPAGATVTVHDAARGVPLGHYRIDAAAPRR